MRPFVDAAFLADNDVVLCDVRWTPGGGVDRAGFEAGHLPGARFVDMDADLAAQPSPGSGRHPLPEPEAFAAAMERIGVGDGDIVVAYDGGGGMFAARLVWMLRVLGEPAAILDGGLMAWAGELEVGPARTVEPGRFTPRPWPADRVASIDEAVAAAGAADAVLIDGRPADRFAGTPNPLDPRPGHVPGASSLPAFGHVTDDARLLDAATLLARFAASGVAADTAVVSMCGSGVAGCHNLLVAEHLGLGAGRLYPGSWSQYAADPERPVELG